MIAALPYIAPWQSGFERFATQIFGATSTAIASATWTVAAGQWWRVIYMTFFMTTDATAGSRAVSFRVQPTGGRPEFWQPAGLTQGPSLTVVYTYSPQVTTYIVTPSALIDGAAVQTIPDVMWGPGTVISGNVGFNAAGDHFKNAPGLAVEIYAEDSLGALEPVATPTPEFT